MRFGRYETLRLIASGGMAKVYLGRARGPAGFERLVAIKVMHDHIAADPEFGHMFLDEARLAAGIRHPNVVPTLDVAEDGRFLVMELIDGASLRDILHLRRKQNAGLLPVGAVVRILLDTLEGLHAAHEHCDRDGRALHIVHRDISPHNILVGSDGIARITDFGIARAEARLTTTREGQLKGKMPYMAPEQLRNTGIDQRVDVYAAGCVLWELLTGERLFTADSEAAVACMVLDGAARLPSELNSAVPAAVEEACMQALAPLDRRFQSARAFAGALEQAAREAQLDLPPARELAAITEGLRPSLPPPSSRAPTAVRGAVTEVEGAVISTTTRSVVMEGATTTLDVDDSDDALPLAVRPVRVVGTSSAPPGPPAPPSDAPADSSAAESSAADGDATSASLVAPVSRRVSSRPTRGPARLFAIGGVGAALAFAFMWIALRDAPEAAAPEASSPEPAVSPGAAPEAAPDPSAKSLEEVAREAAKAAPSASAAPSAAKATPAWPSATKALSPQPAAPPAPALPAPPAPALPAPAAPKPAPEDPAPGSGELHPERL